MRYSIAAVATITLVACSLGTRAREYEPAQHPAGVQVTIVTTLPQPLHGELLAVDDTSVTIVSASRLWLVPFAVTRHIDVRRGSQIEVGRRAPGERDREGLRLRSRFPQGMDPELRARVLAAYGQTAVEVVRP